MVSEGLVPMSKLPGATVLILVLVEDGLGGMMQKNISATFISLNPCFSGGWSRSTNHQAMERVCNVLILVLVEDGLGEQLLELAVSETVATKFLISLTFGDQKYVPFRALSCVQIYGLFL